MCHNAAEYATLWHMIDSGAQNEASANGDTAAATPPYVSWATLLNAIERMENEGDVPSRLDRSYLKNMPGSTQARFRQACRWLGLVDAQEIPTDMLRALVKKPDERKMMVGTMLRTRYAGPLALPSNATQQMLEEAFRDMGSGAGETARKSIAFFLHACKYAEIELSKQFVQPRQSRAGGNGTRKPRRKVPANNAEQTQPASDVPANEAPNIIRDLLTKLPPEGSKWERAKVEQWLGIARLTFEMVYELEGEYTNLGTSTTAVPPGGDPP